MALPGTGEGIKLSERTIRKMPCLPSTETEEHHVQYHEILLQFFFSEIFFFFKSFQVSLSSVKHPLVIQPLSQYTITNWIIFMFLIPELLHGTLMNFNGLPNQAGSYPSYHISSTLPILFSQFPSYCLVCKSGLLICNHHSLGFLFF